jgi:hypothetical protein
MANINVGNATSLIGNTALVALSTTVANVVSNPSSSSNVYRFNTLIISNVNTAAASATVQINRGGANTVIVQNLPIAANSMSVVLGKDTMIYLLENDTVQITASANGYLQAVASWEQIS